MKLHMLALFVITVSVTGCATRQANTLRHSNALNVSWGDQIVLGKGADRLDTPEHIRESLALWQEMGRIDAVYWRISSWIISNYHEHRKKGFESYFGPLEEIEARCNPRDEARKAAHDLGMKIYGYMTIFDEGSPPSVLYGDNSPFPWQSKFTIEHPEYLACDRTGQERHWGVMEYWYPAVREYKIAQALDFLEKHNFDGIYICTRTHSLPAERADMYGFNEPVVQEYRKRHGVDIRREEFDMQTWRDLRGEGLTLFFSELSQELRKRGKKLGVGIPRLEIIGPPYSNMTLHWREWVSQGLIDELVVGVNSGNFHYPSQRGKDKERGYLASGDEHWGLASLIDDIRNKYGPVCHKHGVVFRTIGNSVYAIPPLDGHMLGAASFGSHTIRVAMTGHPILDLQSHNHTVDLHVFPNRLADFPRLLSKYNHSLGDEGRGWEIMIGEEGKVLFRISADGQDRHFESAGQLTLKQWNHVACGFDSHKGTVTIIVNGEATVSAHPDPAGLPPRCVSVPACIGAYGGGGRPFDGLIADVRFWPGTVRFSPTGASLSPGISAVCLDIEKGSVRFGGNKASVMAVGNLAAATGPGPTPHTPSLRFGASH